jgi:hypothetical protein
MTANPDTIRTPRRRSTRALMNDGGYRHLPIVERAASSASSRAATSTATKKPASTTSDLWKKIGAPLHDENRLAPSPATTTNGARPARWETNLPAHG